MTTDTEIKEEQTQASIVVPIAEAEAEEERSETSIEIPHRFRYVVGLFLLDFPFLFCNFYFVENANMYGCLYIHPQKNTIDIYTYLVIQGCVETLRLYSATLSIMKYNNVQMCIYICYFFQVFIVLWSIAGGYTFYQSDVSSQCSYPIYLYMNVLLMFNFIIGFIMKLFL
jgi:hypothetical protein